MVCGKWGNDRKFTLKLKVACRVVTTCVSMKQYFDEWAVSHQHLNQYCK